MRTRFSTGIFYLGLFLTTFGMVFAEEPTKVTLETMNDPSFGQAFSLPRTWWLDDNTAFIYDSRKPDSVRVLERFDPASGRRLPAIDWKKAQASFSTLFADGK